MKKKENASHVKQTRLLRLEALEARQLLSATAYDFSAIGDDNVCVAQVSRAAIPETIELTDSSLEIAAAEAKSTVVTTAEDVVNPNDGRISLREAITLYSGVGDTITFSSALKGKTITLNAESGPIVMNETNATLTIDASNLYTASTSTPGVTISGGGATQILAGYSDVESLTIKGVKFTNGNAEGMGGAIEFYGKTLVLQDCSFTGNIAVVGGAVFSYASNLTVTNSEFIGNAATIVKEDGVNCTFGGGAIYSSSIWGEAHTLIEDSRFVDNTSTQDAGALCCDCSPGSTLTVKDSEFTGNTAADYGGAISCDSLNLTVDNSTFSNNTASYAGAINAASNSGDLVIERSQFVENEAEAGGALMTYCQSTLTVNRSEFIGNTASSFGEGGALHVGNATTFLDNTLIAGNSAYYGGGLALYCEATIRNSTIANNSAIYGGGIDHGFDDLRVYNSIIAGNTASESQGDVYTGGSSNPIAWNVLSGYTDWNSGANQLAYNASLPLFTNAAQRDYSLADASQAINRGNNAYVTSQTDLAGNARIAEGTVDLGAYEYGETALVKLDAPTWNSSSSTATTITVKWNAVPNASGYLVAFKKSTDSDWVEADMFLPPNATPPTSFTVDGLDASTEYKFKVLAKGDGVNFDDSDYSPIKAVKTKAATVQPVQLDAPTWNSSSSTETTITVKWNAVPNASGYVVVYKKSADSTWSNPNPTTSTSFTINGLDASTEYKFKVLAKGDGVNYLDSDYSPIKAVKTKAATVQPVQLDPPTWKSSSSTDSSITVTWNAVANAAGYVVVYKKSADSTWSNPNPTTSTSFTVDGLNASTEYKFKVLAKGDGVNYLDSDYSPIKAVKTDDAINLLPDLVTWKSSSSTSSSITVEWNAVPYASGYLVEYKKSADSTWSNPIPTTSTSFTVDGLNASTEYKFRVLATNYLDPVYSPIKAVKTKAAPVQLPAPTWKSSSSTADSVTISWNAVANASSYRIEYKRSSDSVWTAKTTNSTTTTIGGLDPETTYKFRAYAIGGGGSSSEPSDVKAVKTKAAPVQFPAPTWKSSSSTAKTITVNWNAVENASSYRIEYKRSSDSDWTVARTTTSTTATIGGLTPDTTYKFRVCAVGDGVNYLNSDYSSIKAAKTKAGPVQLDPPSWDVSDFITIPEFPPSIMWRPVEHASGYLFKYGKLTNLSWEEIQTNSAFIPLSLLSLEPDATYGCCVIALGDGVNYLDSEPSATKVFKTKAATAIQLDAPTWKSSSSTTSSITVNWNAVENAAGYVVAYKKSADSVWTEVDPTTSTSFTINGLDASTEYKFKVLAKGDGVNYLDSDYSPIKAVKTKAATVQLDAPTWKSSSSTATTISVAWNAVPNASNYRLVYWKSTDSTSKTVMDTSNTSITISGLTPDTTYKFQVCAVAGGNESEPSPVKAVKTKAETLSPIQLDPPVHILPVVEPDGRITFRWTPVNGASGYVFEIKESSATSWTSHKTQETSITLTLATGTYKFRVSAIGDGTNYLDSPPSSIKACKVSEPSVIHLDAPTWKSSSSTATTITVAWNAVANASSYRLEYKSSTASDWTNAELTTTTTATMTGLTPDTTYKFRVFAVAGGNESEPSSIKAVKTKAAVVALDAAFADFFEDSLFDEI